jgi:hypothetical protein
MMIDGARLYGMQFQRCINVKIKYPKIYNYNLYAGGVAAILIDQSGGGNKLISVVGLRAKSSAPTGTILNCGGAGNDGINYDDIEYVGDNYPGGTLVNVSGGATNLVNTSLPTVEKFTVAASASYALLDARIRAESFIELQQITGATVITIGSVVCTDGQAVITFGSSNSETFKFRIIND